MIHNDVLRRLRYALRLNDETMLAIFKCVNYEIPVEHLHQIMKKEDEAGFILCRETVLCLFLDGLIIHFRGVQEGQPAFGLQPGQHLSNNDILRKIRIALQLKDEDMVAIMDLADFRLSKSELSALFRKRDHRNYKECGNQVLRNFLVGLTLRYRDSK